MYKLFNAVLLPLLLTAALLGAADSHAQAARPGVVEEMTPIENKGTDESKMTQAGRKVGRSLGQLGGFLAGRAVINSDVGTSTGGRVAGQALGGTSMVADAGSELGARVVGPGEAQRYMVKVRLDSGRVLTVPQPREQVQGISVGDRILVEGRGDQARILPAS